MCNGNDYEGRTNEVSRDRPGFPHRPLSEPGQGRGAGKTAASTTERLSALRQPGKHNKG